MENEIICPQCGAPVTTEICPYCNTKTGLQTKDADSKYPTIDCKEANINFFSVAFPALFAFTFGGFAIAFPFIFFNGYGIDAGLIAFCSLFGLVGLVALIFMLRPLLFYLIVKLFGQKADGTVYGYLNANFYINNDPCQIVKILINTDRGPKFILYNLMRSDKPYGINTKVRLQIYKSLCLILKETDIL